MEVPKAGLELPLPTPGTPDGPRHVTGRLLPDRTLPQLPVDGALSAPACAPSAPA
ncbi:hypothetical protein [Streptomyces sp. NPDC007856]|uniref:hypothetical protein n=1 Tax=Streptomyces sp. NPDC007856 TaxID=3364781 RepID=UPI0036A80722